VSQDQAISPPRKTRSRRLQEPDTGRRTRSGRVRSESVDLGEEDREVTRKQSRGARQGSVESVHSNATATSSQAGGRKRKLVRAGGRSIHALLLKLWAWDLTCML
jgi:hypothetical protein